MNKTNKKCVDRCLKEVQQASWHIQHVLPFILCINWIVSNFPQTHIERLRLCKKITFLSSVLHMYDTASRLRLVSTHYITIKMYKHNTTTYNAITDSDINSTYTWCPMA